MSLVVPVTNTEMMSGVSSYSPTPSAAPAVPGVSASVGTANNYVSFAAAGFVAFGVALVWALHVWGFRFAHVPV